MITVVIPTYNERANLGPLVCDLLALRPDLSVLVVDDNSPDGTGRVADELAAKTGRVSVLHRPTKAGIGPAYVAGLARALEGSADWIVCMDADGSHRPVDLPRLLHALDEADIVLGSRYVAGGGTEGWPLHRRLLSRFGGTYARRLLGVPVADLTGGFKAYRREALARLDLDAIRSDGYAFQIETTWQAIRRGLRVVEVPITFTDRVAGRSKLSRRIVAEAIWTVLRLRVRSLRGGSG